MKLQIKFLTIQDELMLPLFCLIMLFEQMLFQGNLIQPIIRIIQDDGRIAEDEAKLSAVSVLSSSVLKATPEQIE